MGQRLVINIRKKGEIVCNVYYHWSGYTDCSCGELMKILPIVDSLTEEEFSDKHIKMFSDLKIHLKGEEGCDRNEGILEVEKEGIANSNAWGEAFIDVDVSHKSVEFSNVYVESEDGYVDDLVDCMGMSEEEAKKQLNGLPYVDENLFHCDFENVAEIMEVCVAIQNAPDEFRNIDGVACKLM